MGSSEALASRDHFFWLFLSPDFHELWHSGMSTCLVTEFKQQMGYINYLDGRPPQCTTHVSDGFVAHASGPKPLSLLLCTKI